MKAEYDRFDMLMSSAQTIIVLLDIVYDRTKNEIQPLSLNWACRRQTPMMLEHVLVIVVGG